MDFGPVPTYGVVSQHDHQQQQLYAFGYTSYDAHGAVSSPKRRRIADDLTGSDDVYYQTQAVPYHEPQESVEQRVLELGRIDHRSVHVSQPLAPGNDVEDHVPAHAEDGHDGNDHGPESTLKPKKTRRKKHERLDENDPRRRYMDLVRRDRSSVKKEYGMALPPVMNYRQAWSNKQLKYNPFPDDLDTIREKMFDLEEALLFNSQQFVDYWPHFTNIYHRDSPSKYMDNGTQWETWRCRNNMRAKIRQRPQVNEAERKRKRATLPLGLEEGEKYCRVRFRVVMYYKHADTDEDHKYGLGSCKCVPEWVHVERTDRAVREEVFHNHTLESLDRFKRSDALRVFGRYKVEQGPHTPDAVKTWIQKVYGPKTKEVEFLTDTDIAAAAWDIIRDRGVEMKHEVEDENSQDRELEECIDAVDCTTVEGLKQALLKLCSTHPDAAKTILPLLQQHKDATRSRDKPAVVKVLEGENIRVPDPGFHWKVYSAYAQPLNPPKEVQHSRPPAPTRVNAPAGAGPAFAGPPTGYQAMMPPVRPKLPLPPLNSSAGRGTSTEPRLVPYDTPAQAAMRTAQGGQRIHSAPQQLPGHRPFLPSPPNEVSSVISTAQRPAWAGQAPSASTSCSELGNHAAPVNDNDTDQANALHVRNSAEKDEVESVLARELQCK